MTSDSERRRALKRGYKERAQTAGVFQIKNAVNGKVLLGGNLNVDGVLNRHRFMLVNGSHYLAALQSDWRQYGAEAFAFEILEVVGEERDPDVSLELALTSLEQKWLAKLNPFDERGYNTSAKIRNV